MNIDACHRLRLCALQLGEGDGILHERSSRSGGQRGKGVHTRVHRVPPPFQYLRG